ncbi:phosphopantetheine-binding protein [Saccharopolyspora flava]|uniref:Aryl carrier domain-containing protein n=1 Tax=Saccharopolyspora flava TaxID=95161 RepID=A0A1I6UJA4_9PSEU|nr:phosphopantetheine-binding protein [Saccharopolyspora flava]SFT01357.1 Aryl carrier domain-containing protein [Saccharopolyspora flava]
MADELTLEAVREQVAELLYEDPSELTDDEDLIDWGLDSVRIMTLVEQWRKQGVQITFADLAERPTLADWWKVIEPKLG